MNIGNILAPYTTSEFFNDYWERRSLHICRNDGNYFDNLLSIDDLDRAIDCHQLRQSDCRVVHDARSISASQYTSDYSSMDRWIDASKIQNLFHKGSTIIFEGVHRWHQPLATLCNSIFDELSYYAQTNVYVTPPHSRGFGPHFDTHDVFILQIHGEKKFNLYDTLLEVPLRKQSNIVTPEGEPREEVVLRSGDGLYIPRGLVHDAESLDITSAHITLGFIVLTWNDFFNDVLNRTSQSCIDFRKALPQKYRNKGVLADQGRPILERLIENFSFRLREELNTLSMAKEDTKMWDPACIIRPLGTVIDAERVELNTYVGLDDLQEFKYACCGDSVELLSQEMQFSFPLSVTPVIEYIIEVDRFRVKELPVLDDKSKLVFVRRLVKEGCLKLST